MGQTFYQIVMKKTISSFPGQELILPQDWESPPIGCQTITNMKVDLVDPSQCSTRWGRSKGSLEQITIHIIEGSNFDRNHGKSPKRASDQQKKGFQHDQEHDRRVDFLLWHHMLVTSVQFIDFCFANKMASSLDVESWESKDRSRRDLVSTNMRIQSSAESERIAEEQREKASDDRAGAQL